MKCATCWLLKNSCRAIRSRCVDPAVFKDKIVFIGLASSGLVDVFSTPFGVDKGNMPGIQLHATMADNLLSNRFIRPASRGGRIGTVIAAGLLVGLLAALLPFTPAAAGTMLAAAGWTWFSLASFKDGVWLNMAQPLMTMGVALFAGTTYQYFVEGREKRVVKKLFGRYVSRDVYQQLLEHPELAELGGRRREMTVLFSDIRGFTTMTEKGNAEALVAQLNEYFSKMVEVVFRHHGTVDKFVGDMVMALFGAPVDDADHAEHALAAAVEMVSELEKLNRKWLAEGKVQLDIGIGINSGEMIAGNIGSTSIMSYTVIGDNVNLGSRLESLNKEFQSRIIISDATRTRLRTAPHDAPARRGHRQGEEPGGLDLRGHRRVAHCRCVARTRGKTVMKNATLVVALLLGATPAFAQFGSLARSPSAPDRRSSWQS